MESSRLAIASGTATRLLRARPSTLFSKRGAQSVDTFGDLKLTLPAKNTDWEFVLEGDRRLLIWAVESVTDSPSDFFIPRAFGDSIENYRCFLDFVDCVNCQSGAFWQWLPLT